MSQANNNHSSGRSSIFETFHTPNFGDETFELLQPHGTLKTFTHQTLSTQGSFTSSRPSGSASSMQAYSQDVGEEEMQEDDDDEVSSSENAETTLWMSCSPGRDFTDDEAESEWNNAMKENEEDGEENGEEEEEEEPAGESSDDGLPLSKLAGKHFTDGASAQQAKRLKTIKEAKALKDKKTPKKRTAYSFFYRDTQNAIKSQNPAATFGEISKIVASMWDHLEGSLKEAYNRRAKEYNEQQNKEELASTKPKPKKIPKLLPAKSKSKTSGPGSRSSSQDGEDDFKDDIDKKDIIKTEFDSKDDVDMGTVLFDSSNRPKEEIKQEKEEKPRPICNYTKCQNPAIDDPRWDNNYCSAQCVVTHCKDVFKAWVANRKSAYCET